MTAIDLNADVGEGFGRWVLDDHAALLQVITSANVACGYHAGDASTMRRVCALAAAGGVRVGAQVSYRDLPGFGRRFIDVEPGELAADVLYQIGALAGIARAEGTSVAYVKPHGALYNAIVTHEAQAAAVVAGVAAWDGHLPVYGLPGSAFLRRAAGAGLQPVAEAFADRAYTAQGTLVDRREPGAVLTDPGAIAERVVRLAREQTVLAQDGTVVPVPARTVCVHGDTPGAVDAARRVRAALAAAGVQVRPAISA